MGSDRELTPRQAAFVREYLVDLNGTQAAIRAGYSPATANEQAARLLAHASVRAAVDEGIAARASRVQVTAEDVIRGLLKEAQADDGPTCKAGRVKAWEMLARHLGMMAEKSKLEVSGDMSLFLAAGLDRYRRQALAEKFGDDAATEE